MPEASLVPQTMIETILAMDSLVSQGEAQALVEKTQTAWGLNQQAEKFTFLNKAALVYSLATTAMPDNRKKWQHVRLTDAHFSSTFAEFCLAHLEMDESTASNYKLLWDLYVVRCRFSFRTLRCIGVSKLVAARKLLAAMWPAVDQRLLDALQGDRHRCQECNGSIQPPTPLACPHCHMPFRPIEPASYSKLLLVLKQIRDERQDIQDQEVTETESKIVADIEAGDGFIKVIPSLKVGEETYPLPLWEIPIIGDTEMEVGLPESQLAAGEGALRRLFR